MLVYLFLMDIVYIVTSVAIVPIAYLVQLLTCNFCGQSKEKANMAKVFEDKLDSIYEIVFGMGKMDIKGFRRLRTIS